MYSRAFLSGIASFLKSLHSYMCDRPFKTLAVVCCVFREAGQQMLLSKLSQCIIYRSFVFLLSELVSFRLGIIHSVKGHSFKVLIF